MQRTNHTQGRPDKTACPQRSSVLICIAIVLIVASAGPVSAASVPQVTGISPSGGPVTGGTVVTVTGSGFFGATGVRFGEKNGTALIVVSDSRLTVVTPPQPSGTVDVSVTRADGTGSTWKADAVYMYEDVPRPRVSGISPATGPVAGGTMVTITGSGFFGTEYVRFGELYGWDMRVVDDSHLRVATPASPPGIVPVFVKNAAGIGSSTEPAAMFQYEFPFPELTGISPSSGSTAGGTVVTIRGSGLSGATTVRFGGIPATGLTVIDDGLITVISPPNPAGTVGLSVSNPDHAGNSAGSASVFRYDVPVPRLATVSPASGSTDGGTVVTITGSGLSGATGVTFGGKAGTNLTVIDDGHLRVMTPASSPGLLPISVTSRIGAGDSLEPSTMFRYEFPPSATMVVKTTLPAGDSTTRPAVSFPPTSMAPAAPVESGTMHTPGFGAVFCLSALGLIILLRKKAS